MGGSIGANEGPTGKISVSTEAVERPTSTEGASASRIIGVREAPSSLGNIRKSNS